MNCFIINLKERVERKISIFKEFADKPEFCIQIEEAIKDPVGAIGLWKTIKKILAERGDSFLDYILICEDDHQFTQHYSSELLHQSIEEARIRGADILCGGVSWFENAFPVSNNLFWVEKFSGMQFTIIFKKFFQKIFDAEFGEYDAADYKISELTTNKYFIHPFISVQKEFGYSDVTFKNDGTNRVEELFATTEGNAAAIREVTAYYQKAQTNASGMGTDIDFEAITIPTYIINLPESKDQLNHILNQFAGRKEFDLNIIEACTHEVSDVGHWLSICKAIKIAIANDDDVIIICKDDHAFTEHYDKETFLCNVLAAHAQGCNVLSAGTRGFNVAVPVAKGRYWVDHCWTSPFIVIYRKFFDAILNEPYDDRVVACDKYSTMTTHKMVLYPFISVEKYFGVADATQLSREQAAVSLLFENASKRLAILTPQAEGTSS